MFSYNGLKNGAGDRDRTGMTFRSRDFKSEKDSDICQGDFW